MGEFDVLLANFNESSFLIVIMQLFWNLREQEKQMAVAGNSCGPGLLSVPVPWLASSLSLLQWLSGEDCRY